MKLIVADLDGTLVYKKQITDQTFETIKKIKEQGHFFTVATGRHIDAARNIISKLQVTHPVICSNGAMIINPKTNEVIYQNTIHQSSIHQVVTHCLEMNVDFLLYTTKQIISDQKAKDKLISRIGEIPVLVIPKDRLIEYAKDNVVKVLIIDERVDMMESLKEKFRKINDVKFVSSQPSFLDVGDINTSKKEALIFLSNYLKIDMQDVFAIGDQENDMDMVETAGVGIAMGDGHPELKEIAKFVTRSFEEEGFSYAMEKLVLK